MLDLIEIKRIGETIEAKYRPENSDEEGFIKIDAEGKVLEKRETSYDKLMGTYFHKAYLKLMEFSKKKDIPEKYCMVWY